MNWKKDLKLSDLDGAAPVEVTCRRCGQTRTETAAALMRQAGLEQAYLDEVERALKCAGRTCHGSVASHSFTMARRRALSVGWHRALVSSAISFDP